MGLGGVGHVNVRLHLRHEVDATSRMGLGLGGVGWGMSTFACTCVMKLMLRHALGWGWVGWGGACQRSLALASWSWCYVTDGVGVGWGGVRHVNVRLHLNSADLLAKTGLYLAKLWAEKGKPNSERFWPQNAGRVDESILRWTFLRNFFGPRMCVWLARERRFWEIMGRWKIRRDVFGVGEGSKI